MASAPEAHGRCKPWQRSYKSGFPPKVALLLLAVILLAGLLLNALVGWWWADAVAGLCMVPIIVNEGREALRGETCSDCH